MVVLFIAKNKFPKISNKKKKKVYLKKSAIALYSLQKKSLKAYLKLCLASSSSFMLNALLILINL